MHKDLEPRRGACRDALIAARRPSSTPSGCRSRRAGSSRARRAFSPRRRTCTTGRRRAARFSMRWPASGASTPAMRGRRSSRRSPRRPPRWTSRRRSTWRTRRPSSSPRSSSRSLPPGLDKVFFTNSGSEAVDTALKMAIAYHRARGEGQRTRLIGRERGYHGVNFGGISVGGIAGNRKSFGTHGRRRRPPAPHARPQEERVLARPARARRRARRRPRAHRHAARRIDDRRRHRRAGRRLDRRPASAQGLPRAAARDLRQARHPADLRRGHHRLRPPRHRRSRRPTSTSRPT